MPYWHDVPSPRGDGEVREENLDCAHFRKCGRLFHLEEDRLQDRPLRWTFRSASTTQITDSARAGGANSALKPAVSSGTTAGGRPGRPAAGFRIRVYRAKFKGRYRMSDYKEHSLPSGEVITMDKCDYPTK